MLECKGVKITRCLETSTSAKKKHRVSKSHSENIPEKGGNNSDWVS